MEAYNDHVRWPLICRIDATTAIARKLWLGLKVF